MEIEAENNGYSQQPDLDKVLEKIAEIAKKSADGDYIYRGEHECYDKVSSNLYREYKKHIEAEPVNIGGLQKEILKGAIEYTTPKMDDIEILTELQHYGGKTNLIDFTIDYFVALFFACDGEIEKPGRVILLRKQSESDSETYEVTEPPRTIRRAEAQKSIFVQAEQGFVVPDKVVRVPADLKSNMLEHLRKHHDISARTIYNDLLGFIDRWKIHESRYMAFYKGFDCHNRVDSAKTQEEKQKWYDAAITHYTESIRLDPEDIVAYNNRGAAYGEKGEVDRAIQDFDKAIDLNPEDAVAYNNRGKAYDDKGEVDRAIQDFDKAIDLNPEDAEAYASRGVAYHKKGDFNASIQDHNKAIDLNPEDITAYVNRGAAYGEKGEVDRAIQDFDKAIDLNPEHAVAYNSRGVAYDDKGEVDRAIQDFDKAIDLNPEHAVAYYRRGLVLLFLRDWEEAEADLTAAKDKGIDIAALSPILNKKIEAFERKNKVKVPENIVALWRGE